MPHRPPTIIRIPSEQLSYHQIEGTTANDKERERGKITPKAHISTA